MSEFRDWFKDEDHDLFNYPVQAMEEAWDAAIKSRHPDLAELNPRDLARKIIDEKYEEFACKLIKELELIL